ncbi:putative metal-binding motif-containing protein [Sorangium sp. So ce1036]|uniref:putative metal-binding motif-containing protein n=1 Tax=Sorangium sp. So ce1036 TaxID=3133328 RepID=UPI003EFE0D32
MSLALLAMLAAPEAHARRNGMAVDGCNGCHNGGAEPDITIDLNPARPAPGEAATVRVLIEAVNGGVGGLYLRAETGQLATINGQGTRLIDAHQLVHDAPKRASGGAVSFEARWIAPATPGGAVLKVWGLSANGDGGSRGDGPSAAQLTFAFGCDGTTYYLDRDGDGHGDSTTTTLACSQPPEYAAQGGDCDDYRGHVHPGADEVCNEIDDDCDGQVDEELEVTTHYEDSDGDGYGSFFGATVMAKCPPDGFAPSANDCDDRAPRVHPDADETCNLIDDDCDGRADEGVRPVCGIGLCAREASTCDPASCVPGEPSAEVCNALDDDCDGEIDEDADVCAPGQVCSDGRCVGEGTAPPVTTSASSGASVSTGTAGSAGAAGSGGGAPAPGTPPEPGGSHGGGCAIDPEGASPWPLLAVLSPLALAARRRSRRAGALRTPCP